jgi:hypothetical protein
MVNKRKPHHSFVYTLYFIEPFWFFVISGFRHDVDEICALLGYYIALSGSSVPTFRDNLSVPSPRVKKSKKTFRILDPQKWDW